MVPGIFLTIKDFSALCVLEEFKNQSTIANADRVLKAVGETLAREQMKHKKEYLPSASFVSFPPNYIDYRLPRILLADIF
jgi:hypothetical protein